MGEATPLSLMKQLTLLAVVLTFASAVSPFAQVPDQGATFRSSSQTVAIYATVLDSSSRLVSDLEQKHFEVFDNLKPQPLTLFKSDVQPIKVVVMLDTSGSM